MTSDNKTSQRWEGVNPADLYFEDGSINGDAIDKLLDTHLSGRKSEESEVSDLDTVAGTSYAHGIRFTMHDNTKNEQNSFLDPDDPVDRAVGLHLLHMILKSIEIPVGPVNSQLEKDPSYQPELREELENYFSFLESEQPALMENVISCFNQLEPPKNKADDLKCVVAIPVAGHQEHGNIRNTLMQCVNQDLSPDTYEIFLYLNLPGAAGENDKALAADILLTLEEIRKFSEEYPDVQVRKCVNTYRGSAPIIGSIRSDLWNIVGYDMKQRGRTKDILVVSADADIIHMNRQYLSGMVEAFEAKGPDMVTAELRWQMIPGLPYDSYANRILRYQSFLDHVRDKNSTDFLHTADANTGLSLATYFAVGGYDRSLELGEMNTLANRIRYYRQANKDSGDYDPVRLVEFKSGLSVLKSHPRRLVKAMALGHSPYSAWDQRLIKFGSSDELRTEDMQAELAEKSALENWKKWMKDMTPAYMQDLSLSKKRRILKQARRILGFSDLYK